jgi:hypothetical protein
MTPTDDKPPFVDRLAATTEGLEQLARFVADHPDFPEPSLAAWQDDTDALTFQVWTWSADELAAATRLLKDDAPFRSVTKSATDDMMRVTRQFGPVVRLVACSLRHVVCERIVTGTETVEVPDPDAPRVTVERDTVEWKCGPILAEIPDLEG